MPGRGRYHHGDLRRAVVDAAVEIIAQDGIGAVSLRDLARRAGVSHAAPAHHFKDKAGLLTAIAIEGFEILADSLEEALSITPLPLLELGVRYVRFATDHPGHFEVMYRPDIYDRDDPELLAARYWARRVLRSGVSVGAPHQENGAEALAALAAWSLAHGFATLVRSGNLDEYLQQISPTDLFRRIVIQIPLPSQAVSGTEIAEILGVSGSESPDDPGTT
ncbi:TetR/AcrR family transcriptional regulator [Saccharomonospora xinjiangensis]|uniref:Transcriptional regulator n=1 Tax=Saccharomonospora xinjiangensis XJ-54 TaxID=882086 RepID=I0V7H8_9PSEU|nr:TetR/AcrR family transcriptional regulator [Saccharomonospora xinjiangensis]EID56081.1 transcriptional regulator [Saccharomonospora xinjiangensis XJ-54]